MKLTRCWPAGLLFALLSGARADVAPPPPAGRAAAAEAAADEATRKLNTCLPRYEETPGPRGTLITHRIIEYDILVSAAVVTPPQARLRPWLDRWYRQARACFPAALTPPERLPVTLHILLAARGSKLPATARVSSVVAMSADRRVDAQCLQALVLKQEEPSIAETVAQARIELALVPFCVVSHEVQQGAELPASTSFGFGSKRRHLMPPPGK